MLAPMFILAVGAVLAGLVFGPTGLFLKYISQTPNMPELHEGHSEPIWVLFASTVIAVVGIFIGYGLAQKQWNTEKASSFFPPLADFGRNRLYIDAIYDLAIVKPMAWFASVLAWFDDVIVDGITLGIAGVPRQTGLLLRRAQSGAVSSYALVTACGVVLVALWIALK